MEEAKKSANRAIGVSIFTLPPDKDYLTPSFPVGQ